MFFKFRTINFHVFLICKNYFCFFIGLIGFSKVDFLESQTTHVDFFCLTLSSNATPAMFLFFVFFHILSSNWFFSSRIEVLFSIFYHSFLYSGSIFWQFILKTLILLSYVFQIFILTIFLKDGLSVTFWLTFQLIFYLTHWWNFLFYRTQQIYQFFFFFFFSFNTFLFFFKYVYIYTNGN